MLEKMEAKRTIQNRQRYRRKKVMIRMAVLGIFFFTIGFMVGQLGQNKPKIDKQDKTDHQENEEKIAEEQVAEIASQVNPVLDDWRLRLANKDHILPSDFTVELTNIDKTRKFDSRAIGDLQEMMNDLKRAGYTNIWVQSSYRSIDEQERLYNNRVNMYIKKGKTQEEAEALTQETINKPGASDHNLGLAVDFNEVTTSFDRLKGYKWLEEHAQEYGFILRYPEDKVEITGVTYEPWHWRYVGQEHAKVIKEKGICLEEYIEFLKNQKQQV